MPSSKEAHLPERARPPADPGPATVDAPGSGPDVPRGFTLLEVLVVLFIISVLTGLLVVRIPSPSGAETLAEESARLVAVLRLASDEAVISGRELGFDVRENLYRFLEYDPVRQSWKQLEEPPFQPRQPGDGVGLVLQLEERRLSMRHEEDERDGEDANREPEPPIMLLSSGEVTPFTVELRAQEGTRAVTTDGFSGFNLRSDVP